MQQVTEVKVDDGRPTVDSLRELIRQFLLKTILIYLNWHNFKCLEILSWKVAVATTIMENSVMKSQ